MSASQRSALDRFPARVAESGWTTTKLDRDEVTELIVVASGTPSASTAQNNLRQGLSLLFDWLSEQPGNTWQERFGASGIEAQGAELTDLLRRWLEQQGRYSTPRLGVMRRALFAVIGADVIRPSLTWLLTGAKRCRLAPYMSTMRDPAGFSELGRRCAKDPYITRTTESHIFPRLTAILAAKGAKLADITIGDLLEISEIEKSLHTAHRYRAATFKVLQEMGIIDKAAPNLSQITRKGQHSVEELVDHYGLFCQPVRDLFIDYLSERRVSLDYTSLTKLAYYLAGCFWSDLERNHPGIDSLALSSEVARAWRQRMQTKTGTTEAQTDEMVESERLDYLSVLTSVRAFYLDLAEWAPTDPDRWGQWVAPSPISRRELAHRKANRRRKARMDQRTRERLPVLPVLCASTKAWRNDTAALLGAARLVAPGESFTARGETLLRSDRPRTASNSVWAEEPDTSKQRALHREEEHAFWAWAVIEVLRLTGIRIEELTELSHHSLVDYRLPTTDEHVPLLRIAPSKTDAERLLVVSPDLAEVLAAIVSRVRTETGAVPLVRAYDFHERIFMDPAPLLFQHVYGAERRRMSTDLISRLIDEALDRTGLIDQHSGEPLRYTPHDFRRIFITDVIRNGLPPHIAQVLAGHQDINTTMGYKAVYPDEAIQAHLGYLARRRQLRPSEEYRTPTEEEWQQFLGHFERRKVSLGTCARAFQTPCVHEHACVRCSMLFPDPAQRQRLVEICDSLVARIAEAKGEGWLGEVEGLELSLAGAKDKLDQIDARISQPAVSVELREKPIRTIIG